MEILRVEQSQRDAMEQLGTKPKFWFIRDGSRWLFKADARGTGEDWAEVIVGGISELLGLPHVDYELAEEWHNGQRIRYGVVCQNMVQPPVSLILGNQLLFERDPDYPKEDRYHVKQHTFEAVCEVLRGLAPPSEDWMPERPDGVTTALDVFTGYMLLDAFVANPDRHHENWGAIRDDDLRLAPTFDHGSSLARGITDREREERLTTKDRNRQLEAFTVRARSAIFADASEAKAVGTFELLDLFAKQAPAAAASWLKRASEVDSGRLEAIIQEIPGSRMTELMQRFTLQLLLTNQRRFRQKLGS